MTAQGTPDAEVEIDEELLRCLLVDQMPEYASLEIAFLDTGWDNISFRLGEALVIRMPRRQTAAPLLENEQRWLPTLAKRLPIPIPAPIAVGGPGHGYPWNWSLLPWIPGQSANPDPLDSDQAPRLANFLAALHQPAPSDAPQNMYRCGPLASREEATVLRMNRIREATDQITPDVEAAWRSALDAPEADESTWVHGDLHARNVLVENGHLAGIIDWGDMTSGDGAVDLAAAWMLFESAEVRKQVLSSYGACPNMCRRAFGWAVFSGVLLLDTGLVDNPQHAAMGKATLRRITEDG